MIAARARELYDAQAKERQRASGGDKRSKARESVVVNLPQPDSGKARDKVGELFHVSGSSVDHATKVLHNAIPEVIQTARLHCCPQSRKEPSGRPAASHF